MFAQHRDGYPESNVVLAPAARTADPTAVEIGTTGARGLIVVINKTAHAATPSVVVTIKGVHYPSGKTPGVTPKKWTILASAAITDATANDTPIILQVAPGLTAAANAAANALLPDVIEISAAHGDADSLTYSVSAILTP